MSFINIPSYTWLSPVDTIAELPPEGNIGDVKFVIDLQVIYWFDGSVWAPLYNASGSSNSFVIIQTPNGTSPTATSSTDTLTFTSSDNSITITGNAGTDTIDLVANVVSGVSSFNTRTGAVTLLDTDVTGALGFTPEDVANKSTSIVTDQASNTKYPSVKAVYDWSTGTFQPIGNYITALTGDGTASGPGSATFTLTNTAVTPASYGPATALTVDSKGRITAASSTTNISAFTNDSGYITGVTGTANTVPYFDGSGNLQSSATKIQYNGSTGLFNIFDSTENGRFLSIDEPNSAFGIGDIDNLINAPSLALDKSNQTINIKGIIGGGYGKLLEANLDPATQTVVIGDIDTQNNNTIFTVDIKNAKYLFSKSLFEFPSGAPSFTGFGSDFNFPTSPGGLGDVLTTDGAGNTSWTTNSTGTVTSVALSLPAIFSVSGSPVTTSGTLSATLASQLQNLVFASPNGSSGTPTFRSIVAADVPTLNQNTTGSAATLTTPRNINGVAFNGSADITVTADAGTLTGTTLNATVVSSSLTSVGTITTGTWHGSILTGTYGGTGVDNNSRTITIAGNLTTTGAFNTTLAAQASVTTTLPPVATTLAGKTGTMAANYVAYWNDANQLTGGSNLTYDGTSLIMGGVSTFTGEIVSINRNANSVTGLITRNTTSGTAARALLAAVSGTNGTYINSLSASYTTSGMLQSGRSVILSDMASGFNVGTLGATPFEIWTSNTQRMVVSSTGQISSSTSFSGALYSITNSNTGSGISAMTLTTSGNGFTSQNGTLVLNSTTATSSTIQTLLSLNKTNINATTTQEMNIEYATRDNSSSRASGTISFRYSDTGSGTQKTRFTLRNLVGGTTLTDAHVFDGYNMFCGGGTTPTALVHMAAGTATANTAPLQFTAGVNETTARAGVMEYDGTNLFFTRTGTTRENVLVGNDGATAPTTNVGVAIVNYYGTTATNFLGDPNSWASVVIGGVTYKIPLYT
jgi:hypothetical protein